MKEMLELFLTFAKMGVMTFEEALQVSADL